MPAPPRPRRGPRLRALLVVAGAAAVLLAGGWQLAGGSSWLPGGGTTTFEVHDRESGRVAYARDVPIGQSFELRHRHSVTRRIVIERFSVPGDGTISLDELWFDKYGANLPAGPDQLPASAEFRTEGGAFRVIHHDQRLPSVPITLGSESVDHTIIFDDGVEVRLLDVARAGAAIELRARDAETDDGAAGGR